MSRFVLGTCAFSAQWARSCGDPQHVSLTSEPTGNQLVGVYCCDARQPVEAVQGAENLRAGIPYDQNFKLCVTAKKGGYQTLEGLFFQVKIFFLASSLASVVFAVLETFRLRFRAPTSEARNHIVEMWRIFD
jgi:hypothetical protein